MAQMAHFYLPEAYTWQPRKRNKLTYLSLETIGFRNNLNMPMEPLFLFAHSSLHSE